MPWRGVPAGLSAEYKTGPQVLLPVCGKIIMTVQWRVDLEDTTGTPIAVLKNFISFTANTRIAGKGDYQLVVSEYDPVVDLFDNDFIVRAWRADPGNSVPWTNVFTGIHKTFSRALAQSGTRTFSSFGPDSHELLDKSFVLYPANTPFTTKSAPVSTCMLEFVRENVTALATVANGRDIDGVNPITVGAGAGLGPVWDDRWVRKNLLEVLQRLRDFSISQNDQIDFLVSYLGGYQWRFDAGNLFEDRTVVDIDTATGLNGAGNVPIQFSPLYNNVYSFSHSRSRYNEINAAVALGQQQGSLRQVAASVDGILANASPIAQRESITNAQNNDVSELQSAADSFLESSVSRDKISLDPRLTSIQLWRDFNPGDFVTVVTTNNLIFNKQVTMVTMNVANRQGSQIEDITLGFTDVTSL